MKKSLLFTAFIICAAVMVAQGPRPDVFAKFIPYHRQVEAQWANPAQQGISNSRAVVYKQIGLRRDVYDVPGNMWKGLDSSRNTYNSLGLTTSYVSLVYNNAWYNNNRGFYNYNSQNLNTNSNYEEWIPYLNDWRKSFEYISTYTNTLLATNLQKRWDTLANAYINSSLTTYTYNAQQQYLSAVTETWSGGAWQNSNRTVYTRDANGNVLTYTVEDYNGGAWVPNYRYSYLYDASNQNSQYIYQVYSGGNWLNQYRYDYEYNAGGDRISTTSYSWISGAWVKTYRSTYDYTATKKLLLVTNEAWKADSSKWVNYSKEAYAYNASDKTEKYESFSWIQATGAYRPSYRVTYTYDGNQNILTELNETYITANSAYRGTYRYFYYWQQFDVAGLEEMENELGASIYPNPCTGGNVQINLYSARPATAMVGVYNISGQLIYTRQQALNTGDNNFSLALEGISPGNYFVLLQDTESGKSGVLRLVKQ